MPNPQAEKIILSSRQQTLLKQIVRRSRVPLSPGEALAVDLVGCHWSE
ncbi:MAG: hypothetical protein KME25_11680 [Symplocastrum torsivum CPER-KK1]|uniref:Uncharacterized protein n=1 Tax=Symplocastrum torsivum CPER-KK1 TaxID=450513 RepID=A0A951PJG2_9CYAN|nr:hypothetical protein [Symplocastrum torsivum CPER-KK1]